MTLEWSKIKNIILIMLLVVNAFLLVLVLDREARSARYEETARDEAIAILAQRGIQLERDILPKDMTLAALSVSRDAALEAAQAAALVGEPTTLDAETLTYHGPKGTVKFYVDGEFSAVLEPGAYPTAGASVQQAALDALALVGFSGVVDSVIGDGAAVTVQLTCNQAPVFVSLSGPSRRTVATFRDGELRGLEGYRLTGTPVVEPGDPPLGVVTILLRFLAHYKSSGDTCNEITSLTPGYALSALQGGQVRLIPAWHIVTDTSEYYMNAITGNVF